MAIPILPLYIKRPRKRDLPHVLIDVEPATDREVPNTPPASLTISTRTQVVLKMTYVRISFLFMGDANADAESRIANSGTNLQTNFLKVGHHGSATSSSSAFLSKVHPMISVIEVRVGNPYGHPTSAILGSLVQVGSAVYRTDLNDDVTVTTDVPRQRVWCPPER